MIAKLLKEKNKCGTFCLVVHMTLARVNEKFRLLLVPVNSVTLSIYYKLFAIPSIDPLRQNIPNRLPVCSF